jgi:nitrite reductase/ring-hydroxylating ferredoxin subunit
MIGNIIMCIAHGAQFDVTNGAPLTTLAKSPIKAYDVRVNGEDIEIML